MPIDFKYTGDANQLIREYEKLEQKMLRLEERNAKLARESKAAHDSSFRGVRDNTAAMGALGSQVGSLAASYLSVASVIGMVNQTLQQNVQLWQQAGQTAIRVAGAQQEALKNLVGLSTGQKQDVLGPQAAAIQQAALFPDRAAIIQAMGAGFSASGDINLTRSAVEAAAGLTRLTPQALETVSAGALDVARGSGVSDAKQNLAFLLSAGAINRIVDPVALAENLAPLVASGVATVPGQDRQSASLDIGAVFGTLARAATDTTGKTTGSAATKLLSRMEEFFSTREDPGTIIGRIEALQGNEKLRQQFLASGTFEEKYKIPIRQLLTGGSALDAELEGARGAVSFDRSLYDQLEREISGGTPELVVATKDAKRRAQREINDLTGSKMGLGVARDSLSDSLLLNRAPFNLTGSVEKWLGETLFDWIAPLAGADNTGNAIADAQKASNFIAPSNTLVGTWGGQVAEMTALLRALLEEVRGSGRGFSAEAGMQNN